MQAWERNEYGEEDGDRDIGDYTPSDFVPILRCVAESVDAAGKICRTGHGWGQGLGRRGNREEVQRAPVRGMEEERTDEGVRMGEEDVSPSKLGLGHRPGTISVGATIAIPSERFDTLTSAGGPPPLDLHVRVVSKLDPTLQFGFPVRRNRRLAPSLIVVELGRHRGVHRFVPRTLRGAIGQVEEDLLVEREESCVVGACGYLGVSVSGGGVV